MADSIGVILRTQVLADVVAGTSIDAAYKGPHQLPVPTYPWAEVILGNAQIVRMLYGPVEYDREVSIIVHAKAEDDCLQAIEELAALYEGSSTYWQTLKAVSLGSGNQLLDIAPVEGAGSFEYDGANNEHIGIAEFTLRYRKAVT